MPGPVTFELSPILLQKLTRALRGRSLSWLDGGGAQPESALGRYSHLAWGPNQLSVTRHGEDPFAAASAAHAEAREHTSVGDASTIRSILALGYDASWSACRALGIRSAPRHERDASTIVTWVRTYDAALVYDHLEGVARLGAKDPVALEHARLDVEEALASDSQPVRIEITDVHAEDPGLHQRRIREALEAIGRGDLYQVNLARPFRARYCGEPFALAEAMRGASPVPLGAYLEGPEGITLISRTMERFLSIDGNDVVESRPIKGTISEQPDAAEALLASSKERAEHTMIVDLVRNDLGRIAEAGSVRTPSLLAVEPYARLSHLVSRIQARLRPGVSLREVLLATFPPASISGAPKLAAIEHIEALEDAPRGFYTGALGMIARDGSLSLSVAIRTAELHADAAHAGSVTYFAGGGIVEASDPGREVEETELKARAFLDAVGPLGGPSPEPS